MREPLLALVCVASLPAVALATPQQCEMNGLPINPNNGSETAGKTGMLRCKVDGKLQREQEYKNGKHVGHEMMIDWSGNKIVRTVTEMGNPIGVARTWNAKGVLIREETYGNGKRRGWTTRSGLTRTFDNDGKLKHETWYDEDREVFSAAYLPDGKLTELRCGEKSWFAGDKALCGFDGRPHKVELYGSKGAVRETRVYLNGKLQQKVGLDDQGKVAEKVEYSGELKKKTELFPDGKVKLEAQYHGRIPHGDEKEFHASGKLVRVTHWNEGNMETEETYYLNGQHKSSVARKKVDGKPCIARRTFWDNGKVQEEGIFEEKVAHSSWGGLDFGRWTYESPIGDHRSFYESGVPAIEEHYDGEGRLDGIRRRYDRESGAVRVEEVYAKGVRKRRKEWDESGKLALDEEYLEDGSRVRR